MKKKSVLKISAAALMLIQLVILLYSCCYTFFTADDYWYAAAAGGVQTSLSDLVQAAWRFMSDRYVNWQGTYLSMFLQIFLCPLNMNVPHPYRVLHILLMLVCVLFFFSMYLALRCFLQWLGYFSRWGSFVVYTILITAFLSIRFYYENFFWFSGIVNYTIPITLALFGMVLLRKSTLNWEDDGKRSRTAAGVIGSSFLLFLACGGTLELALPVCYVLLLWLIIRICQRRSFGRELLPFLAACAGTLINGAAPGNYVRHAVTAEDTSAIRTVYHAVLNALFQLFDESSRLFDGSALGVMFFAMVFAGVWMGSCISRRRVRKTFWLTVLIAPLPAMEIFAVVLGYGSVGLPERTCLLPCLSLLLIILNLALCIGVWAGDIWGERRRMCVILTFLMTAAAMTDQVCLYRTYEGDSLKQLPMSVLAMDAQKGWTAEYYQEAVAFYKQIEESEEQDVTVNAEAIPKAPEGLMPLIILNSDSLAQYYGKSGVTVVIAGDQE